jgi:hypothetical protein
MEKITTNSTMMIAWQDHKLNSISGIKNKDSISEFRIPGVGGVKSQDSSSQESRSAEMRNDENPEIGTSIGVSDIESWRSQESRLFIIGVLKCQNVKSRKS